MRKDLCKNEHCFFKMGTTTYQILRFKRDDADKVIDSSYCKDIVHNAAIYLYLGCSGEYGTTLDDVYVGQATDWSERIDQHHDGIEDWRLAYWKYTFVFTADRDSWDRQQLDYLEYMFYWLARVAGNYNIVNNQSPTPGTLDFNASKRRRLNEFIVEIANKLRGYGFPVFKS